MVFYIKSFIQYFYWYGSIVCLDVMHARHCDILLSIFFEKDEKAWSVYNFVAR